MRRRSMCALLLFAALLILSHPAPLPAAETIGTIMSVDAAKRELVLGDSHGRRWKFQVSKAARVLINNRPASLVELGAGDSARVIYNESDKHLLATEITAMQM
jgi:hypothetical protein